MVPGDLEGCKVQLCRSQWGESFYTQSWKFSGMLKITLEKIGKILQPGEKSLFFMTAAFDRPSYATWVTWEAEVCLQSWGVLDLKQPNQPQESVKLTFCHPIIKKEKNKKGDNPCLNITSSSWVSGSFRLEMSGRNLDFQSSHCSAIIIRHLQGPLVSCCPQHASAGRGSREKTHGPTGDR